jgi:hypothetical protein
MTGRHRQDSEEDVQNDPHVAASREGKEEYVGRTASDDSFDAGETGAEARGRS